MNRWSPFRLLSAGGARGRLSIFIFHRVLKEDDEFLPYDPGAARFDRIVGFIARNFTVLPLSDAANALQAGALPPAAACITFDDGYADNVEIAAPILRRHGVGATFFIATAYTGGGRMWNDVIYEAVRAAPTGPLDWRDLGIPVVELGDTPSRVHAYRGIQNELKYLAPQRRAQIAAEVARRADLPSRSPLMMSRQQVRQLVDLGMEVGGHTQTHPILAQTDDRSAREEIAGGREVLTEWLGFAPRCFAYPNGKPGKDYGPRDVAIVRESGYSVAVSTAPGVSVGQSDLLQLPRYTPGDPEMWRFALRSLRNLQHVVS